MWTVDDPDDDGGAAGPGRRRHPHRPPGPAARPARRAGRVGVREPTGGRLRPGAPRPVGAPPYSGAVTTPAQAAAAARPTRGQVLAWGLWDWGSAAYNTIILTFVFSVYLTDTVGDDLPGVGEREQLAGLVDRARRAGAGPAGAGARAPGPTRAGRRRRSVGVWTAADRRHDGRAGRRPRRPPLPRARARPARPGVDLLRAGVGVLQRDAAAGLHAGDDRAGLRVRLGDGLPRRHRPAARGVPGVHRRRRAAARAARGVHRRRLEHPVARPGGRGVVRGVRRAAAAGGARAAAARATGRRRRGSSRPTGRCCTTCARCTGPTGTRSTSSGASALFRDGLAAVFTFGAVLAVTVYGIAAGDVLVFGVVANVVSAARGARRAAGSTTAPGPRPSSSGRCSGCWSAGPCCCSCPARPRSGCSGWGCACSSGRRSRRRGPPGRLAPPGHEGELFGLYATTGRAVSFLAPTLVGVFTWLFGVRPGRDRRDPRGARGRAGRAVAGAPAGRTGAGDAVRLRAGERRPTRRWHVSSAGDTSHRGVRTARVGHTRLSGRAVACRHAARAGSGSLTTGRNDSNRNVTPGAYVRGRHPRSS